MIHSHSADSPGATASPSSSKARHGVASSCKGSSNTTPSFFIIQEPLVAGARSAFSSPKRDDAEGPDTADSADPACATPASTLARQRQRVSSRREPTSANTCTESRDRSTSISGLAEERAVDATDDEKQDPSASTTASLRSLEVPTSQPFALSILSRCGSSPELPLHNALSTKVYSSSKTRLLLKPTNGTGGGPHFTAMQRSRLVPLPINIRTGTLKRDSLENQEQHLLTSLKTSDALAGPDDRESLELEAKMNYETTITALKERIAYLDKQLARANKQGHAQEKQIRALLSENQTLRDAQSKAEQDVTDLDKSLQQQRHAYDKLIEQYAAAHSSLERLAEGNAVSGDKQNLASIHVVVQTLARESMEYQRKLRVLEQRHVEDKTIGANQEKTIKRLQAEIEALRHLNDAKTAQESASISISEIPALRRLSTSGSLVPTAHSPVPAVSTEPSSLVSLGSIPSSPPPDTILEADEIQYVDTSILKVLQRVDSQFSITNAINLSVALKKWLHSCLQVVVSTDVEAVLQVHLQRICELLHCQHAAIFHADHVRNRLVATISNSGHVRWELPLDKGILGHAVQQNTLINVRKAYDDARFFSSADTITGTTTREIMCVPITHELDALPPTSVFAVLQTWNTTTEKPFSPNDEILAGLLAIQAGTIVLQSTISENLQRLNKKILQLIRMPRDIAVHSIQHPRQDLATDGGAASTSSTPVSLVYLVRGAQKKLAEILGIPQLRIFILEPELMRIWHVGAALDAASTAQTVPVRKYANVHASLCGMLLSSAESCITLMDPVAESTFNDTADLKGGALGLYLAAIRSPWSALPLGMVQIARTASCVAHNQNGAAATASMARERELTQDVQDTLNRELLQLFCDQFACVLHHATAIQLYDTCPREVQQARLAYISDRLDDLESEYLAEQQEAEDHASTRKKDAVAAVLREHMARQSFRSGETEVNVPFEAVVVPEEVETLQSDESNPDDMRESAGGPDESETLHNADEV